LAEGSLARVLRQEGQWSEAESLLRHAVEIGRRVLGPDHSYQKRHEQMLAAVLGDEGRYEEAERLHRELLEKVRRTYGTKNISFLDSINGLAQVLINTGRYSEAGKLLRDVTEIGDPHGRLHLATVAELGIALDGEGRHDEAERLEREAFDGMSQTLGPKQPDTLNAGLGLATILMHEGRYEEAGKLAQQVQETNRLVRGERDPITAAATYTLARIDAQQANLNDSFSLLQQSIDNGLDPNHLLQIEQTPDLKRLHGDPRWSVLVLKAKEHAAAFVKPVMSARTRQ
jgi:tetratricopeptide (TPR) repeat protein